MAVAGEKDADRKFQPKAQKSWSLFRKSEQICILKNKNFLSASLTQVKHIFFMHLGDCKMISVEKI
jgi:hypothetical protein